MSVFNPERTKLMKRSILWMMFLIVVMGITYYNERTLFQDNWNILTASTATRELPIYCVKTDKKQVALSFDAAWGNEDTQLILNTLKKYNIHVTFFMTGSWIDKYPDDVKAIKEAGHDLGNHSESHKHMPQLSTQEISDEISKVNEKIKKLTGVSVNLFRPPYGDYNNNLIIQARSLNCYTIQWNVDSLDWKNYGVNSIIDTVLNNKDLKNGSIILMHNGAKYTADALPKVIEGLKAKGYEIIPVSQLIYTNNFHMEADGTQVSDAN